jgi:hypothetical protein
LVITAFSTASIGDWVKNAPAATEELLLSQFCLAGRIIPPPIVRRFLPLSVLAVAFLHG